MVGAYGNPRVNTPNLDRLASQGIRFERAYTTCPLCTPARGGIFSGLHPQVNGAYCNNVAPHSQVVLAGTIFRENGYRAAYTGKWHLDGSAYFGDGMPGGGFEPDLWYDGKKYAEDIGPEMFNAYRTCMTPNELRKSGFSEEAIWGHRVADRAVEFLESVGECPFFLVVSFDEPHAPFVAPPEYWEQFDGTEIPQRPNFMATAEGKPELLRIQRYENLMQLGGEIPDWQTFFHSYDMLKWYGCNSYIDREIGRVVDAVEKVHANDTIIIYTSDHGDQSGSHGLKSKGPMMYEESCNVPFLMKLPETDDSKKLPVHPGWVCDALISHIDILPTLLDYAGIEQPEILNGKSICPLLEGRVEMIREYAMISFHRFAINHDSYGELYLIRCVTDGKHKLVVNLFETDELYDLNIDPYEMSNLIDEPDLIKHRNHMHDWMLGEMDRIRDPFRTWRWGARQWRSVRKPFYSGGKARCQPTGFSFQSSSIDG